MSSVHKSLDQGLDKELDNENQLIIVCHHCSLTTTQTIGIRKRTICPHCGNFYSGDNDVSRSINSGNRMLQSLPSISKISEKPGPLRSITNFFKKFGPRNIQRKNNSTTKGGFSCVNFEKSQPRFSYLSRLNSNSHGQLPLIKNLSPFEVNEPSRMQLSGRVVKEIANKRSLKDILNKSVDELLNEVSQSKETGDWNNVKEFFAAIFDNSLNLNIAFEKETFGSKKDVDHERIFAVFDILAATPPEVQKICLKAIISNLFRDVRIQNKEEMRSYAILLLNPQFQNPSTYTIFAHLLRQISILKDHHHHYLVQWFKTISKDRFKEMIQSIQRFISTRLASKHEDLPPINKCHWWMSSATKVLALLYAASNLLKPPIVSYHEFYNSSIDQLDLMAEYFNWQSSKGSNSFSFCQYPFILTLTAKRTILQKDSEQQMVVMARKSLFAKVQQHQLPEIGMLFLNLTVRRSHLVSDSLNEISRKQTELKKKLKVTFAGEPGLDMGGLTKEWFLLLTRQIFQPEFGMFTYDKASNVFWFSSAPCDNFQEFNLVGVLMGLAVYNSIILDIRFPPICYRKILSPAVVPTNIQKSIVGIVKVGLDELKDVHPEVAKGLQELLDYNGDVQDDIGITFQITYDELETPVTHELKENGRNIPVTNANREEYVQLYVDFILNQSIYRQFQAFYHGFHSVCASNALILLRPEEIELLVCGNPSLDMNELKKVTIYDGYNAESETIKYFWEVVTAMPTTLQKKLLLFTTGSDRVPVSGMSEMQFKVTRVENINMLPVSQTCFNQLVLPAYNSKKLLKQKLLVAIQNAEGFGLE